MERALSQLNIPPQWDKVTGKGVRYAVLDYASGDKIVTPINSLGYIHYHSYSCQYIMQKFAPNAEGFGVRVLGKTSEDTWPLEKGLKWCLENDIDVINLSLHAFKTPERIELIKQLVANGTIICAATGNENNNSLNFPADQPGVISVGAYVASTGKYWGNSNSGPGIEVIAPTYINNIPHWEKGKPDISFNGTSCATPCISGVACLWKEAYPKGNVDDFIEFLKTWAIDYGEPGFDEKTGYGKFRFPEPEKWIQKVGVDAVPILPVKNGKVSQEYGRKNTIYKKGYHTGIDFVAGENDKYIYSIKPGIAIKARCAGGKGADPNGWGNYVIVRQYDGYDTIYAHLSQVLVQEGEAVSARAILGIQGSTGNSTGPHLHFEVRGQPWGNREDINAAEYLGIANAVGLITKEQEVLDMSKFKDVDGRKWYAASIDKAVELGLMGGTSETTFDPERPLTRAELAAVAVRIYEKLKS